MFYLDAGACQLYFGCLQKLWPVLLGLQLGAQHAVSMVPFVSLTCDILKFKIASDGCNVCDGGCHCVNSHSVEEGAVLSCQTHIVDICTHSTLPKILGHCRNLFEAKKCLSLFARICSSRVLNDDDRCSLCSAILDTITSSSLVKCILLNWLSQQSECTDIQCIRDLFGLIATAETFAEVDADKSLLATMVRKLTVLTMKCLNVTLDGGNGKKQQ